MVRFLIPKASLPWLGVLLMLFNAPAAWAQTTGAIEATVYDDQGLELPGVLVILDSASGTLGGKQEKSTADDGKVKYSDLLPGTYTLTASRDGFKAASVTGIQVLINRTQTVTINMEPGGSVEVIEVVDKREAVDVENVTRGEVLTKDFLQKIPAGRTYQSAVQMAAGVVAGSGGNPNMGGAANNENTYMLDGVTITDPVTGTFSMNFNYDAIQQIEVMLGGYEPEYGISLGGMINLVTESGTNNLQFDTSAFYQNGNWAPKIDARYSADGFQISPTGFDTSWQTYDLNAKVAGPVVRDRAWFLFSYAGQRSLYSNVGVDLPRDYDAHYILGKLTMQPTSEHRLTFQVQTDPTTIDNTNQGGGRVRPEAQGRQAQGGGILMGRWQWFLTPNTTLDTQTVYQRSFIESNAVPCTHNRDNGYHPCKPGELEGDVDWETPGRYGSYGAFDSVNYGSFYFDDRMRYEASSKLAIIGVKDPLGGSHDFKLGVNANQTIWDQIQGYAGNAYYVDLNEVSYNPQTFLNYYWIETSGPIKFRTGGAQWSMFAQDAYKPRSNLTLKYGLRFDHTIQRNDVGEPVINTGMFGPRAYASWDPFGDGKTKVAGGYGRFNDTGRLGVSDFTSNSQYGYKLYLGEYFQGDEGTGFLNNASQMYDVYPRENPNTANPNLRTPHVDEFILMLQRELVEDVSIGANFTEKLTRGLYEYDETNVIYDGDGSSVIGSRLGDDLTNVYRLRTPYLADRNYTQIDAYLDKVESRRWAGRLTYTYTQSSGTSEYSLSGSFANDPQTRYNDGPFLNTDVRHQVKGFAYWSLPTDPWVQTVGVALTYTGGSPYDRYYWDDESGGGGFGGYGLRIRDRASYGRIPGWWDLSVNFSQDIDVRKGKLAVSVQALNLFNLKAPQWIEPYYVAAENRLFVAWRQDPLSLQLGARYSF